MNRFVTTTMILSMSVFTGNTQAEGTDTVPTQEEATAKIVLTKLDVNDAKLEMVWKIRNDTDHDIWICASLKPPETPSVFEHFLDNDGTTLLIRRRFELPIEKGIWWEFPFYRARYVRLRPGQERAESISLAAPIRPYSIFSSTRTEASYAQRLSVEIGFYDENLPGLILDIVDTANKLGCKFDVGTSGFDEVIRRFFRGWDIARLYNTYTDFRKAVTTATDEILMNYIGPPLLGEQTLRITVDGVSIPYER